MSSSLQAEKHCSNKYLVTIHTSINVAKDHTKTILGEKNSKELGHADDENTCLHLYLLC